MMQPSQTSFFSKKDSGELNNGSTLSQVLLDAATFFYGQYAIGSVL